VNAKEGTAVSLSPLFLWGLNTIFGADEPELYEFDSFRDAAFLFKAIQFRPELSITPEIKEVWETLKGMRDRDQKKVAATSIILSDSGT
jgi:hypothetical protein